MLALAQQSSISEQQQLVNNLQTICCVKHFDTEYCVVPSLHVALMCQCTVSHDSRVLHFPVESINNVSLKVSYYIVT